MSKWTLRQQRTRQIRQGYKQEHTAAHRATRYVRRHAWQFHGAGVEDAVRALSGIDGDFSVSECPDCAHAHVEGRMCRSEMGVGFCGCTG